MRFDDLLAVGADEPVFETGLLLAGDRDPGDIRRQLSRWVAAGRRAPADEPKGGRP